MLSNTVDEPNSLGDSISKAYDIRRLYDQFRWSDIFVCGEYLLGRGISGALVEALIIEGDLLHNRYKGRSYCCFAARNGEGELQCLDNH